jgi:tetratricopeptide (TPR) repeat protein/TolB-like protein
MANGPILESWKEIAAHLNRNIRTCQMWEREMGLPIHRLDGSPKARVFAYRDELDSWLDEKLHEREARAPSPKETQGRGAAAKPKGRKVFWKKPADAPRRNALPVIVAGFFLITALSAAVWLIAPRGGSLIPPLNQPSIAVLDFENLTGDASYDYLGRVIAGLLITKLENSGDLSVATRERLQDLLKQLGKADVGTIDRETGFMLCGREGVGAIVVGSFSQAGGTFVTDVKVLDSGTKRSLKSATSRGAGVESIVNVQIDELSREIAAGIGLPEAHIESSQRPIVDLTTRSIEAYNFYLRGVDEYFKLNAEDSRRYLEKAVELDPAFAIAYLRLSMTCRFMADPEAARGALDKAIRFSDKATEKERLRIEAASALHIEKDQPRYFRILGQLAEAFPRDKEALRGLGDYYVQTAREFDKAVELYKRALELDPDYTFALNMLGLTYKVQGDYEKALPMLNRYVALSPGDANPLDSLAALYYSMGDLDKAIEKFKEALAIKPDFFTSLIQIPHVYALKEDYPEAVKWLDRLQSIVDAPGLRLQGYIYLGFHDFWRGRPAKALGELQKAEEIAKGIGNRGAVAVADYVRGWIALDQGDFEASRRLFESHLEYVVNVRKLDDWYAHLNRATLALAIGLAELKQGRAEPAKLQLAEIESVLSKDNDVRIRYLRDILRAETLLLEGNPEKVISEFAKLPPIEPPSVQWWELQVRYNMPPLKDVLGRAYAQKGDLNKAIREYERLVRFNPKGKSRYLIHPKYYYRLAELYEQKGLKAKAIERYRRFLELWKDADPGTAEVEEAKKRLAALEGGPLGEDR